MILAGTGHRPDELGGYREPNPVCTYVRAEIRAVLEREAPEKVISGMALGFDTWLAEEALGLGIPLLAAVPFKGQEAIWPKRAQERYRSILALASEVRIVCEGVYKSFKLQVRNEWMVDRADAVLACHNGDEEGGTANCLRYARALQKPVFLIDPRKAAP